MSESHTPIDERADRDATPAHQAARNLLEAAQHLGRGDLFDTLYDNYLEDAFESLQDESATVVLFERVCNDYMESVIGDIMRRREPGEFKWPDALLCRYFKLLETPCAERNPKRYARLMRDVSCYLSEMDQAELEQQRDEQEHLH